jgi:FkbM family methyltransferase
MTAVTTRYGLMEVIERDSIVSQALMMYGEWAQEELNLLGRFIQPGACVLDAGAFIGTHTLAFARMVGVAGKVYAFEPRREIFAYLQRNIALNGASQVRVCNVALGARLARLAMAPLDLLHEDNFGGLALALSSETADEARYDVEIVTLDGMDLSPVDLIKLDVEGMESEVLAGAQAVIARDRPVIFAECNSLGGGAPLLAFAALSEYRVFGYVCPAYDAANFNKCAENIFGPAKELGLVLLPAERVEMYQAVLTQTSLPEVENLDSLACLLLSKPQYFDEVLAPFCGTHDVKLALATPELAAANEARGRCEAALSEVKELAFARLDEITALKARIEATDAALSEASELALERLDEVTALKARIESTDAALSEARQFAFERLDEIAALKARIEATDVALSEASELALERLDEVTALKARIEPTDVALSEASQFALERLDKVTALKARIESTDAALSKASQLALERLDEIGAQKRQEGEMQAALADARLHAQDLEKRLEGAETELRVLEQNKIWRALRATGLMKAPK